MRQAPAHALEVPRHDARRALRPVVRLQEIGRHHRRQRARDEQRAQHGHDDGEAERAEELARDAAHERDRNEHGDDRQRRRDDGEADLDRGVHGRLFRLLAHAQVPHDVLDLDDRVVDQDADDERQREQRQNVQRVAERPDRPERRNDRQRQGDGGNGRRAPVAQEQPHDDDRENRAFDQHFHRGVERFLDIADLRARLGELHLRILLLEALDDGARVLGDVERAGAPRAHDLEADDGLAVEQRSRALLTGLVAHLGDRIEPHAAAVGQRDRQRAQVVDGRDDARRPHGLLEAAEAPFAARDTRPGCGAAAARRRSPSRRAPPCGRDRDRRESRARRRRRATRGRRRERPTARA